MATAPRSYDVPGDEVWAPWRQRLHDVIFEAETPSGRFFDVSLLVAILASVLVAMLDSVSSIAEKHHDLLYSLEWGFTVLFTVEYLLRLICVRRPLGYVFSFYGLVDLLSIVPTYLGLLDLGWRHGTVVRSLRLLRVFRIFKLAQFLSEATALRAALAASRPKITVFFAFVVIIICIVGSAMYIVEGEATLVLDTLVEFPPR